MTTALLLLAGYLAVPILGAVILILEAAREGRRDLRRLQRAESVRLIRERVVLPGHVVSLSEERARRRDDRWPA